jgi:hypothetical protein
VCAAQVIDERDKRAMQLDRIPFEGFLEAFVRIADVKLLPTEAEMAAEGHACARLGSPNTGP